MKTLPLQILNFWAIQKKFISILQSFWKVKENRYATAAIIDLALLIFFLIKYGNNITGLITPSFTPIKTAEAEIGSPDFKNLFTSNFKFKDQILASANYFMSLPPNSLTRREAEVKLIKDLKQKDASAADLILALEAMGSRAARAYAMEYLWLKRQAGELIPFNIFPISSEKIQWAKENDIDPHILGIAIDSYLPTLKLLKAKPEIFFEASKREEIERSDLTKRVPNPGLLAKLSMTETSWKLEDILSEFTEINQVWDLPQEKTRIAFSNIGSVSAWNALNLDPDWFPSGQSDLLWVSQQLQASTNLPYATYVYFIPGSARGSGDGSGGAIGPQLMPINARLLMGWYNQANQQLNHSLPPPNPFNPWTGTMLAYLYLSSEFYHRQRDVDHLTTIVRPGYRELDDQQIAYNPKKDPRIKALLKWNPLRWQAQAAVKAGESFAKLWRIDNSLAHLLNLNPN